MRDELPATLIMSSERHNAKYRWWKIVSRAAKPAVSRAKPVAGLGRAAKTTKLSLLSLSLSQDGEDTLKKQEGLKIK